MSAFHAVLALHSSQAFAGHWLGLGIHFSPPQMLSLLFIYFWCLVCDGGYLGFSHFLSNLPAASQVALVLLLA